LENKPNKKFNKKIIKNIFGEDGKGDGVLSVEGLGTAEKQFNQMVDQIESFEIGEISNETLKIHNLGVTVQVLFF
jgi:hypothetical protein